LTGGLCWWGEGTEWTCLTDGQEASLREAAAAVGAEIVEERPPSLEEVFLARRKTVAAGSEQP
jgi:ABC-2 type transport system ATP-binding protein